MDALRLVHMLIQQTSENVLMQKRKMARTSSYMQDRSRVSIDTPLLQLTLITISQKRLLDKSQINGQIMSGGG